MATIQFSEIQLDDVSVMTQVFDVIADGKKKGVIAEEHLKDLLGERYVSKFVHEKAAADEWVEKWRANPNIQMPWDFGSWVDAFINADIELSNLHFTGPGKGEIHFDQLACPSGGIDAVEEIVRIFDGKVLSNDAI
ncbi:hypothetical protein GCM10027343_02970 [Noviherbaspirillum agri]